MADGPGGPEVGRVSLRVVPDTSKFRAQLRKEMIAARNAVKDVNVGLNLNTRDFLTDVRKAVSAANLEARDIKVGMDVDRHQIGNLAKVVQSEVNRGGVVLTPKLDVKHLIDEIGNTSKSAVKKVQDLAPEVKVRAVTELDKTFQRQMGRELNKVLAQLDTDLPLNVNARDLRTKVDAAAEAIRKGMQLDLPLGTSAASVEKAKRDLRGKLAELQDLVSTSLGPENNFKIRVLTETDQKFQARAKADLDKALKALDLQIPVTPETETLRKGIDSLAASIRDRLKLNFQLGVDDASVDEVKRGIERSIAALAAQVAVPVKVQPDVDVGEEFKRDASARLRAALAKVRATLPLQVDPDGVRTQAEALARQVAKSARVKVPAELADSAVPTLRADIDGAIKAVERLSVVDVHAALSRGFRSKLQADLAAARAGIELAIPANVETARLRAELDAALARLEATSKLDVPVDLAERERFAAKLKAEIAGLNVLLKAQGLEVPLKVDRKGLGLAGAEIRKLATGTGAVSRAAKTAERDWGKLTKGLISSRTKGWNPLAREEGRLRSSLGNMAPILLGLGGTFQALLPNVISLASGLARLAGGAVLLPSLFASGAAVMGTLAVGISGVGDALKLLGPGADNAKKLDEALKGLAPSAKATVLQLKAMQPALTKIKKSVQQSLFKGMAKELKQLNGGLIPAFGAGMKSLAAQMNATARGVLSFAGSKKAVKDLSAVFDNTSRAIRITRTGTVALTKAFSKLAGDGSKWFPTLARDLNGVALSLAKMIESGVDSGKFDSWISGAISALKDVVSIGKSAIGILSGISKAADAAGGTSLKGFADGLESVNKTVNSPGFQKALTAFWTGINAIRDGVIALTPGLGALTGGAMEGFGSLLKRIGETLKDVAPKFNDLAKTVSPYLKDGFKALGAAMQPVLDLIKRYPVPAAAVGLALAAWANPLVAATAGIALLGYYMDEVQPKLDAFSKSSDPVAQAGRDLGKSFSDLGPTMQPTIDAITNLIQTNLPNALTVLQTVSQSASTIVQQTFITMTAWVNSFGQFWTGFWNTLGAPLTQAFSAALPGLTDMLNSFISGVTSSFTGIMQILRGDWQGAWKSAGDAVKYLVDGIKAGWSGVFAAVNSLVLQLGRWFLAGVPLLYNAGVSLLKSLWNGIKSIFSDLPAKIGTGVRNAFQSGVKAQASIVRALGGDLALKFLIKVADKLGDLYGKAKSAISDAFSKAKASVVGTVKGFGGDLAGDFVSGFIGGMGSLTGGVFSMAYNLGKTALNAAKEAVDSHSPSKEMYKIGRYVTQGFYLGILKDADRVKSAAQTLANKIKDAFGNKRISKSTEKDALRLLEVGTKRMKAIAKEREKVGEKLKAAQDKLKAVLQEKANYAAQIKDSILDFGNITSLGQTTADGIVMTLRARVRQVKEYAAELGKLKKLGLNNTSYAQLLAAGPDDGKTIADALLSGGKSAVKEINSLTKQLTASGSALGKTASNELYRAGVNAAQGLVDGLKKQMKELDKTATHMARVLVKALKRELGIHSPSRVLDKEVGVQSGRGVARGLRRSRREVQAAMNDLGAVRPANGLPTAGAGALAGVQIGTLVAVDPDAAARKVQARVAQLNAVYSIGRVTP